ncbi:MAG: hypothetical protein ABSB82_00695 [Terriglobia bacterium]
MELENNSALNLEDAFCLLERNDGGPLVQFIGALANTHDEDMPYPGKMPAPQRARRRRHVFYWANSREAGISEDVEGYF